MPTPPASSPAPPPPPAPPLRCAPPTPPESAVAPDAAPPPAHAAAPRPPAEPWSAAHPCAGCGYCCTTYRVAFHWLETVHGEDGAPPVPAALTEPVRRHEVAMRGTSARQPRCIALTGRTGVDAHCSIHPARPSPCRAVAIGSSQCTRARVAHGLAPLAAGEPARP